MEQLQGSILQQAACPPALELSRRSLPCRKVARTPGTTPQSWVTGCLAWALQSSPAPLRLLPALTPYTRTALVIPHSRSSREPSLTLPRLCQTLPCVPTAPRAWWPLGEGPQGRASVGQAWAPAPYFAVTSFDFSLSEPPHRVCTAATRPKQMLEMKALWVYRAAGWLGPGASVLLSPPGTVPGEGFLQCPVTPWTWRAGRVEDGQAEGPPRQARWVGGSSAFAGG